MMRGQVDVFVGHAKGAKVLCSECAHVLAVYDYSVARTWWHLDSCQYLTVVGVWAQVLILPYRSRRNS